MEEGRIDEALRAYERLEARPMRIAHTQALALRSALPALLEKASTAEEAVTVLARNLRTALPSLWRVSFRRLIAAESQLEIVAVWSAVETALSKGFRMSALASSFPEVVQTDRPVFLSVKSEGRRLLEQVLASEGVQSSVSIPVHRTGSIVGLLSLSSLEAEAFDPGDVEFYAELGGAIEERLVELMASDP